MYGEGGAEEMLAEAMAGRRDEIFLVSKVYPHNASRKGAIAACEAASKRLKTDRLDLYLLHWRGSVPLAETVEAFEALKKDGKIRHGASAISMRATWTNSPACRTARTAHQTRCSITSARAGSNGQLLPKCQKAEIMVMAYSPLGQGPLLRKPALRKVADKHGADPAAVALAWVLRHPGVITIPKAVKADHVRANLEAGSRAFRFAVT